MTSRNGQGQDDIKSATSTVVMGLSSKNNDIAPNCNLALLYPPDNNVKTMTSRAFQWTRRSSKIPLVTTASAAVVIMSWCVVKASVADLDDTSTDDDANSNPTTPMSHQIDISFIDRLASKAYLHFSHEESVKKTRPEGVPNTLRLLTVDLPEIRNGFRQGHCHVDASCIYPDGIAEAEALEVKKGRKKVNAQVEQKAWIKSMVKCMSEGTPNKVSVEIMEADISRMNPTNIRRIHQYGTLRYDPGKYAATSPRTGRRKRRPASTEEDDEDNKALNEIQAPWHQVAWKEEAMLRISGQVVFGETMQEADGWTKRFSGFRYQSTVSSSSRSWLDLIFFWRSRSQDEGVDGSPVPNAASNRPHAVIANGYVCKPQPDGRSHPMMNNDIPKMRHSRFCSCSVRPSNWYLALSRCYKNCVRPTKFHCSSFVIPAVGAETRTRTI